MDVQPHLFPNDFITQYNHNSLQHSFLTEYEEHFSVFVVVHSPGFYWAGMQNVEPQQLGKVQPQSGRCDGLVLRGLTLLPQPGGVLEGSWGKGRACGITKGI